jgi:hypothetical protein
MDATTVKSTGRLVSCEIAGMKSYRKLCCPDRRRRRQRLLSDCANVCRYVCGNWKKEEIFSGSHHPGFCCVRDTKIPVLRALQVLKTKYMFCLLFFCGPPRGRRIR